MDLCLHQSPQPPSLKPLTGRLITAIAPSDGAFISGAWPGNEEDGVWEAAQAASGSSKATGYFHLVSPKAERLSTRQSIAPCNL